MVDEPDSTLKVNSQIVDAVSISTKFAYGTKPEYPKADKVDNKNNGNPAVLNPGGPIAYEKAAQALAYSVQDAVDYQRNILSMAAAAEGKALQLMFQDVAEQPVNFDKLAGHTLIAALSALAGVAAGAVTGYISEESAKALKEFPKA